MQLAAAEGRAHELDAALATYALVEASASTPEARHYALVLRAELLVDMGRLDEAAPLVRQLAADHPVVKKLANARARRRVTVVAIIELVLTVLAFSWLLGRAGWRALGCRLPTESLYFLPMALLFVVAGLTEHAAIRTALVLLALGGLVLVTLFSALVRERTNANSARFGFAGRFAVVAAFILAVLSLFFLVIEYCDLIGLMVETFRHGPER